MRRGRLGKVSILAGSVVLLAIFLVNSSGGAGQTSPPAAIGSSYYVTGECMIIGPQVNLELIRQKTSGTLAGDFVDWGSYRIYSDNTFEIVAQGTLADVAGSLVHPTLADSLQSTFNWLVSNGALDPSSTLSAPIYKGTPAMGTWTTFHYDSLSGTSTTITLQTSSLKAIRLLASTIGYYGTATLYVNSVTFITISYQWSGVYTAFRTDVPITSGIVSLYVTTSASVHIDLTIYTGDQPVSTITPTFSYNVLSSPGTGYAWKTVFPGTVRGGDTIQVRTRFDTPRALNVNITDGFPLTFALQGNVIVEKYNRTGLVISTTVPVTVVTLLDHKEFSIRYTDVSFLSSLSSDEWLEISYNLGTPVLSAGYQLPSGSINYVPLPKG